MSAPRAFLYLMNAAQAIRETQEPLTVADFDEYLTPGMQAVQRAIIAGLPPELQTFSTPAEAPAKA